MRDLANRFYIHLSGGERQRVHVARSGAAVVGVFHDLNLAAALADELVLLTQGRSMAAGPCSDVPKDDLLSAAYGCEVLTNRTPANGRPFVLPPAIFGARANPYDPPRQPDGPPYPRA